MLIIVIVGAGLRVTFITITVLLFHADQQGHSHTQASPQNQWPGGPGDARIPCRAVTHFSLLQAVVLLTS